MVRLPRRAARRHRAPVLTSVPLAKICLITPGHLASTPRLVKNAAALASAGYAVSVVAGRHFLPADPLDTAILASASWRCHRVAFNRGLPGLFRRGLRQVARRKAARSAASRATFARAQHAGSAALASAAEKTEADFIFGHGGIGGLAAAATAAERLGVPFAFDAEDWHEEESTFVQNDPAERAAVRGLLRSCLPHASLVTCAAPLIGDAFAAAYGVAPTCLLNVFPLAEAPSQPVAVTAPTADRPAVLYWFSQTIGPERGLEGMLDVLAHLRTPTQLHLRGFVDAAYAARLHALAVASGARPPVFLPPAPASEMVRLAAGAHLGLSLEQSQPPNRDLCLTNKIFSYLLAGVPVALTPTRAQRQLAPDLGEAALLLELDSPRATAARLDDWLAQPQTRSRAAAWRLGQTRFNWNREADILVREVSQRLPHSSP